MPRDRIIGYGWTREPLRPEEELRPGEPIRAEYAQPRDRFGFPPRFPQGQVYFLLMGGSRRAWPLVKIGFTTDLERRLKELCPNFGDDLIGSIPATKRTETKIHRAYKHHRYALEMFYLGADLDFAITQGIRLAEAGDAR